MPESITAPIDPRWRQTLVDDWIRGGEPARRLLALIAVMGTGAAIYGAVLGMWRGGTQIAFTAIKLPLALIFTSALTMLFNWMSAVLMGCKLRLAQVAVMTFLALAVAAVCLGSLAPVAWLFTISAPEPTPAARSTHNLLYLLHTLFVAGAGLIGMTVLRQALECLAGSRRRARRILLVWTLSFALVGGEVAWALRPFVGSIYYPQAFLRQDALDGNVYEFILRDILPYLLSLEGHGER